MKSYILVFLITALWDFVWRLLAERKLHLCLSDQFILLCPVNYKWVKSGKLYFKNHSVLGAMTIAGFCGVYAFLTMDFISSFLNIKYTGTPFSMIENILLCAFSSWVVGIPMRYANDSIHNYLFKHLRDTYYKDLGFLWSSYTDIQSGIIVLLTFHLIQRIIYKI